jgi:hypothetical protein
MKTVPSLNTSTARETTTPLLPIKVYMRVLGCARIDIRVLREAKALVRDGFTVSIVDIDSVCSYHRPKNNLMSIYKNNQIQEASLL